MIKILFSSFILLLTACGSDSRGNSDEGNSNPSGLPNDISGLIVFDQMSSAGRGPKVINERGIFKLGLNKGNIIEKRTITEGHDGYDGYVHPSGKIVFLESCGASYLNRLKIFKKDGLVTPSAASPCSSAIKTLPYASATHVSGQLSPDETKIATYIYYRNIRTDKYEYSVIIYDIASAKEIKRFVDYYNPTWHPDGRLLLIPTNKYGIYITNNNLTQLHRIDKEQINLAIGSSPDISPSGKQVVFPMGQQIWIMDLNGDNLQELIIEDSNLKFPTWSPDEKYITYLRYGPLDADDRLMFYKVSSGKKYFINTNNIFQTKNGYYLPSNSPGGPLSWIK